jgi:hypothetical protein
VPVEARVGGERAIERLPVPRKGHDGRAFQVGIPAKTTRDFVTVQDRKSDVQQHQVWGELLRHLDRLAAIVGDSRVVTRAREPLLECIGRVGVVVDDEDSKSVARPSEESPDGDADSTPSFGGPVDAAKAVVASLVGLSQGTLAAVRRSPHPLASMRRPFGRFVSGPARVAYAAALEELGKS